ncbi:hypothetical protein NBRGN_072_00090 [Nocardia brasiliensis NBRC 14402]|uniref:DUF6461 domain-containing protein n=1 Tax=Nocardia brasiliensis TaxID=37326 RepID=UPI0002E277CF|nr:DUF6461 domain-containing protein [Nocardia brasiliensis]ASF07006.1 hypothetical protein CEQ30_06260 [Nocardia brasiliensis]GAJ84368.1 hypothetical protein NBRGN_072_00090 [Nocardia brasiliensis NBRC 14402]SUB47753.1 Uncharacterised protein [Nocardia brasiliensis]
MTDIADAVVEELGSAVAETMRTVRPRIPASPAATLGRLRLSSDEFGAYAFGESGIRGELSRLGQLLPERILGALELLVAELVVPVVPSLAALLPMPDDGRAVMVGHMVGAGATTTAINELEAFRPGALALVVALTARLSEHCDVVAQLRSAPVRDADGAPDEAAVAAAHGASHLALGVAVAVIVLRNLGYGGDPATVVGAALTAACPLLRAAPMPAAYDAARIAKIRAGYLYPRYSSGTVQARDHRFALTESDFPDTADFRDNGLVVVSPAGLVVRTGTADAVVQVRVEVFDSPPAEIDASAWDEVVEVAWTATRGLASILGAPQSPGYGGHGSLVEQTPPWPGTYRVRVHATGRDDADGGESYKLAVWQSPDTETVVHKRTDRLGHRLRGEAEPPLVAEPEDAYRWVEKTALAEAGTITVVAAVDPETVVRAFGADPAVPERMDELEERAMERPWIAVASLTDAVLAVEYNGYQGSRGPELRALSRGTRAASLYWNVNGLTQLSFAADGRIVAAFELGEQQRDRTLEPILRDLDFDDYRNRIAKGLVAVERFTGSAFTESDLARVASAGIGFAVLPLLGELNPVSRRSDGSRANRGHGPLGADTDLLTELPTERQQAMAWWAVGRTAEYVQLVDDPDVVACIETRTLTAEAELRARRSTVGDRTNYWFWSALHQATNPDPLGAAIGALDAARYAWGPAAADFVDEARIALGDLR